MRYALAILIVSAGLIAGLTTGVPGPDPERPVRESPGPMVTRVIDQGGGGGAGVPGKIYRYPNNGVGWTQCTPTSATAVPGQCYVSTTTISGTGGGQ